MKGEQVTLEAWAVAVGAGVGSEQLQLWGLPVLVRCTWDTGNDMAARLARVAAMFGGQIVEGKRDDGS